MKNILVTFMVVSLITGALYADSDVADVKYMNLRQSAMGGVRVAVKDPISTLFNNPAGLNQNKKNHFRFPRFSVMGDADFKEQLDKIKKLQDAGTEAEQLTRLRELTPSQTNGRVSGELMFWTRRNFGFGAYGSGIVDLALLRKSSPQLRANVHGDIVGGMGLAGNTDLMGNTSIGATVKYIYRRYLYDKNDNSTNFNLTQDDLLDIANDDPNAVTQDLPFYTPKGIGVDIGILRPLETEKYGKGQWGLSMYNLGATLKGTVDGATVETKIPVTTAIGFSLDTESDSIFFRDTNYNMDFNISSPYSSFKKNLHMGFERKLWSFWGSEMHLRGGLNQGFVVGGFGLKFSIKKFPILHIDYAYLAEELGEEIGHDTVKYHSFELGLLF